MHRYIAIVWLRLGEDDCGDTPGASGLERPRSGFERGSCCYNIINEDNVRTYYMFRPHDPECAVQLCETLLSRLSTLLFPP